MARGARRTNPEGSPWRQAIACCARRPHCRSTWRLTIAREHFGIDGRASALPSERDQNFLITAGDEPSAVLKVASAAEERGILEAQQAALAHLARSVTTTPRVFVARHGASLFEIRGDDGRSHLAWAVGYLPGKPLAQARYRSPRLFESLGRQLGAIDAAFSDFDHPAVHRDFYWDIANARATVSTHRSMLIDAGLGAAIDTLAIGSTDIRRRFSTHFRSAVVHGDPNDYNILVGGDADVESRGQTITGIVDLGDMVYSYRVADLAIAMAYVMLDAPDPLAVAARLVRGFSEEVRLDETELAAVFGLATMRLCGSACIAASQLGEKPDHDYLGVSQAAIARTLPRLARIPFGLATAVLREAAGLEPAPCRGRVVEFLAGRPAFASVLAVDARTEPSIVLDLSVASPMLSGDTRQNDEPSLTRARRGDHARRRRARVDRTIRRAAPALCRAGIRARPAPHRRTPDDTHRSRPLCRRGHAGLRAARRRDRGIQ